MRVHARPVFDKLECLHDGLSIPCRDLVVEKRGCPDSDEDNALVRKRLRKVNELCNRAVITTPCYVDDSFAPAGDGWRWRGRLVDVQKDRANG